MMLAKQNVLIRMVLFLCLTAHSLMAAADPKSTRQFYADTFGVLEVKSSSAIARVDAVFNRLLQVVDKARSKDPQLIVVNSPSWPWAIALPDNSVVVTKGSIDICYQGVPVEVGDARMAMVLGHELAHLAKNDYWHRDIYLALSKNSDLNSKDVFNFIGQRSGVPGTRKKDWQDVVLDREIRADDDGFLYAALAGFEVKTLLSTNRVNFFQYWKEQTKAAETNTHLSANDRALFIQARYSELMSVAEAFELGINLIHLRQLDHAELIFRDIRNRFPSHEVFNNLGVIYLLKSNVLSKVSPVNLYWLPTVVDDQPSSQVLTRGMALLPQVDIEQLEKAGEYFRLAIEQRPGYLSASLNLASTNMYLGHYNAAIASLKALSGRHKQLPQVRELIALATYESLKGRLDILQPTYKELSVISSKHPDYLPAKFNLAQLYSSEGKTNQAQMLWNSLSYNTAVPEPYRTQILLKSDSNAVNRQRVPADLTFNNVLPKVSMARIEADLMELEDGSVLKKANYGGRYVKYSLDDQPLVSKYTNISASKVASFVENLPRISTVNMRQRAHYRGRNDKFLLSYDNNKYSIWVRN